MDSNPLVSIIIPAFNCEKTIRSCLSSVLNQDYKNFEIIVVDNNSQDKTKNIILEFINRTNKIKYILEKKVGRGSARNAGIDSALGEIIAMIDSDCVAPNNWLKNLINPILSENEIVVLGSEEPAFSNYWSENIQKSQNNFAQSSSNNEYANMLDTKNCAFRADFLRENKFNASLGNSEDFAFYLKIKDKTKIRYLRNIKVKHFHKTNMKDWFLKQLDRGFWTTQVYKKETENRGEKMFESFSIKNWLLFLPWTFFQLIKRPKEFIFIIVSEIGWRMGVIRGFFINIK